MERAGHGAGKGKSGMKITRLQPPTIEEVQWTISALEKEFRVSSGKFASNERAYRSVPEDIAANWDLALHQLDVLRPLVPARERVDCGN